MQKTMQVQEPERFPDPTGDPLADSGFEQEQTDPDFASEWDEEAEK
jgi:hypothetical protein